ncbi:MAG: hypothetical protein BWZ08_01645 [candidate division BRC1 bacterium ADurb.BinA292]|nr:MAG: hypothetical protein BWZ08_01645 [candidate division BRC1 bacterium ADurb.BinA292]
MLQDRHAEDEIRLVRVRRDGLGIPFLGVGVARLELIRNADAVHRRGMTRLAGQRHLEQLPRAIGVLLFKIGFAHHRPCARQHVALLVGHLHLYRLLVGQRNLLVVVLILIAAGAGRRAVLLKLSLDQIDGLLRLNFHPLQFFLVTVGQRDQQLRLGVVLVALDHLLQVLAGIVVLAQAAQGATQSQVGMIAIRVELDGFLEQPLGLFRIALFEPDFA